MYLNKRLSFVFSLDMTHFIDFKILTKNIISILNDKMLKLIIITIITVINIMIKTIAIIFIITVILIYFML